MNEAQITNPAAQIPHIRTLAEEAAIDAALAANRPLLVRGEPGTGKTQLAVAAAVWKKRPLVSLTVNAATTATELLWTFDAVQRLAEAQVAGAVEKDREKLRDAVSLQRFVRPGPLWWAFNWKSAADQVTQHPPRQVPAGWSPADGVVLLIDEIDKGETDVPNGLLEALGSRQFTPTGWSSPITAAPGVQSPLIVITTNEERSLPDAFVRRCLVLRLDLPVLTPQASEDKRAAEDTVMIEFLMKRGQVHFPQLGEGLLREAAVQLVEDRRTAIQNQQRPWPGQAEYLDYLRVAAAGVMTPEYRDVIRGLIFRKYRRDDR